MLTFFDILISSVNNSSMPGLQTDSVCILLLTQIDDATSMIFSADNPIFK